MTNDALQPAPIFLMCSERSGSNLISTIVGEHPGVYAHPPYHMGRDLIFRLHEVSTSGATAEGLRVLVKHAQKRISGFRGEEEAARLGTWVEQQADITPAALARFVFQQMPPEAQGKRAFIKENNVHELLFFLLDCFPDARLIFQVRDPRDFLLSAKLRKKRWLGNKFGSLRNALQVWRADQLGGLSALGLLGPKRVFLQRYEDLVAKADEVLPRLCEFLGLEFDPRMLDFHRSEGAQRMAVKGGPRENVARPLMTSNFRKYRKGLSSREIRIVEAYVGDLMDRFGYPREYPGRPSLYTVLRPQLTEPLERLINNELRAHYRAGNRRLTSDLAGLHVPLLAPLWDDGDESASDSQ